MPNFPSLVFPTSLTAVGIPKKNVCPSQHKSIKRSDLFLDNKHLGLDSIKGVQDSIMMKHCV